LEKLHVKYGSVTDVQDLLIDPEFNGECEKTIYIPTSVSDLAGETLYAKKIKYINAGGESTTSAVSNTLDITDLYIDASHVNNVRKYTRIPLITREGSPSVVTLIDGSFIHLTDNLSQDLTLELGTSQSGYVPEFMI